jgi:hypothetical protein
MKKSSSNSSFGQDFALKRSRILVHAVDPLTIGILVGRGRLLQGIYSREHRVRDRVHWRLGRHQFRFSSQKPVLIFESGLTSC